MSRKNDGREFQKRVLKSAEEYQANRVLRIKKVDPPLRYIGPGKMLHLENPFLDFVGVWNERGGRAIFIETKSTTGSARLPLGQGGLTDKQVLSLHRWALFGAVSFLLWENKSEGSVILFTAVQIDQVVRDASEGGRKHLRAEDGVLIPQIPKLKGFFFIDFLPEMRRKWTISAS